MRMPNRCLVPVLLVALSAWHACSNPSLPDNAAPSDARMPPFETISIHRTAGHCGTHENNCAEVTLIFPLASVARDTIRSRINQVILESILQAFPAAGHASGKTEADLTRLEVAAETFLRQGSGPSDPDAKVNGYRQLVVTGESTACGPEITSVSLGVHILHEDDHPVSYTVIHNFDLRTGSLIGWEDLVDSIPAFRKYVGEQLRQHLADPAFHPGAEAWPTAHWPELPQHFELTADGLYLWYNPFELGMYSSGPTDLLLPYEAIRGFLRSDRIGCISTGDSPPPGGAPSGL